MSKRKIELQKHLEIKIIKRLKDELNIDVLATDDISNNELAMWETLFELEEVFCETPINFIDDIFFKKVKTVRDGVSLFLESVYD